MKITNNYKQKENLIQFKDLKVGEIYKLLNSDNIYLKILTFTKNYKQKATCGYEYDNQAENNVLSLDEYKTYHQKLDSYAIPLKSELILNELENNKK